MQRTIQFWLGVVLGLWHQCYPSCEVPDSNFVHCRPLTLILFNTTVWRMVRYKLCISNSILALLFVTGQVDLWTQSPKGCACPRGADGDCACCVRDGACPCGDVAPARCAQCGLEQYCANSKLKRENQWSLVFFPLPSKWLWQDFVVFILRQ